MYNKLDYDKFVKILNRKFPLSLIKVGFVPQKALMISIIISQ